MQVFHRSIKILRGGRENPNAARAVFHVSILSGVDEIGCADLDLTCAGGHHY